MGTTLKIDIDVKIKEAQQIAADALNRLSDLKHSKVLGLSTEYSTEQRNFGTKRNPDMHTVKLMHYKDYFKDEDTGEVIEIDRKRPVEVDGFPCNEFANKLKAYKTEDF